MLLFKQSYRTAANDTQIRIARDINKKAFRGSRLKAFKGDTVDTTRGSLSALSGNYTMVTEACYAPPAIMIGKMIELPKGVFDFKKTHGEAPGDMATPGGSKDGNE